MVFGKDMLFRQNVLVNWELVKDLRRKQHQANNKKENQKRKPHQYKVGDWILLVKPKYEREKQAKLMPYTEGPYKITKVYTNGNLRILRGTYTDKVSICRVRPYYMKT